MKKQQNLRHIILISILIALGVVFSILDGFVSRLILSMVPIFALIAPNLKFGFANVIIMIIVYNFSFKEGLIAVLLKSLIVGFLLGGSSILTFTFSFSGSLVSFLVMVILSRVLTTPKSTVFISAVGGFAHIASQLAINFIIYQPTEIRTYIIFYTPFFLLTGIITGIIVGLITIKANASVEKHLHKDY